MWTEAGCIEEVSTESFVSRPLLFVLASCSSLDVDVDVDDLAWMDGIRALCVDGDGDAEMTDRERSSLCCEREGDCFFLRDVDVEYELEMDEDEEGGLCPG